MKGILEVLSSITTGYALALFAFFTGIYLVFRSRFMNFKDLTKINKVLKAAETSGGKGIKPLQSLAMSLGAHVGIGNIVGVGYAISFGGVGAIFWMWMTAIVGSTLSYFESVLASMYKKDTNGQLRGGLAYYAKEGMNSKKLGIFVAVTMLISVGFFWTGLQSNATANAFYKVFGIPHIIIALAVVFVVGAIIYGGAGSIAKVAEKVVPFMAITYITLTIIILLVNIKEVPEAILLIFKGAFNPRAVGGGFLGETIVWGIKRGFYSNEAGMGTSPHFVASVETKDVKSQAVIQMLSVFIDTLVICTLTALVIIVTKSYNVIGKGGEVLVRNKGNIVAGIDNTIVAFESVFPQIGSVIITIMLAFFALTTLISLYYIGETNLEFLRKDKKKNLSKNNIFKLLFLISILIATVSNTTTILHLTDIGLGINAWINLTIILLLQHKVINSKKRNYLMK